MQQVSNLPYRAFFPKLPFVALIQFAQRLHQALKKADEAKKLLMLSDRALRSKGLTRDAVIAGLARI